jgi:DNA modification methylase
MSKPKRQPAPDLSYIAEELRQFAVPIASLVLDPANARDHGEANRASVRASLTERGQTLPITVRLANRVIMTGNCTVEEMLALGHTHVAALFRDYTEAQAAAWAIAHNRTAELATWDYRQLGETMAAFPEADWLAVGHEANELEAILAHAAVVEIPVAPETTTVGEHEREIGVTGDDEIPEPPVVPITSPGDLWILGDHRLICGSCREPEVVARLLDGTMVNIAFTSPPYASRRKYDESSGFDPVDAEEFVDWFDAVQANVRDHLADGGSWFVNIKEHCDDGERHLYVKDLAIAHKRRWGWRFIDELCWRRVSITGLYPNRFKNGFEPVFHFALGKEIKFRAANVAYPSKYCVGEGDQRHAPKGDERDKYNAVTGRTDGMALPSNVIDASHGGERVEHSAVFPVSLPSFFIKAYSDSGDAIFDPFMGSGTTIIACERLGRRGFGCEISPRYCDVIVARWEAATGRKAERIPAPALP